MKKVMNKVFVLILIILMFVVLMGGNSYVANDNKCSSGLISVNQINETFLKEYVLKYLPKGAKLIGIKATIVYFKIAKMFLSLRL